MRHRIGTGADEPGQFGTRETGQAMTGFLLAGAVAVCLGVVAARLMRVAGLVLVLAVLVVGAVAAHLGGFALPSVLEAIVILGLVQAGYLMGAVLPAAKPAAGKRASPLASEDDRAAG